MMRRKWMGRAISVMLVGLLVIVGVLSPISATAEKGEDKQIGYGVGGYFTMWFYIDGSRPAKLKVNGYFYLKIRILLDLPPDSDTVIKLVPKYLRHGNVNLELGVGVTTYNLTREIYHTQEEGWLKDLYVPLSKTDFPSIHEGENTFKFVYKLIFLSQNNRTEEESIPFKVTLQESPGSSGGSEGTDIGSSIPWLIVGIVIGVVITVMVVAIAWRRRR